MPTPHVNAISARKLIREYGLSPSVLRRQITQMRRRGYGWLAAERSALAANAAIAGYRVGQERAKGGIQPEDDCRITI